MSGSDPIHFTDPGLPVLVPQTDFARILYTNPVCLLTTSRPSSGRTGNLETRADNDSTESKNRCDESSHLPDVNVMTISWLTPTTNVAGGFMMSMNASRYSAKLVKETRRFVLNVPVRGMEETVRSIGRYSGGSLNVNVEKWTRGGKGGISSGPMVGTSADEKHSVKDDGKDDSSSLPPPSSPLSSASPQWLNKFHKLGIKTCKPGWRPGCDWSKPTKTSENDEDGKRRHEESSSTVALTKVETEGKDMMKSDDNGSTVPTEESQRGEGGVSSASTSLPHPACDVDNDCILPKQRRRPSSPHGPTSREKKNKGEAKRLKRNEVIEQQMSPAINESDAYGDVAIEDCVAHLVCTVQHILEPDNTTARPTTDMGDNNLSTSTSTTTATTSTSPPLGHGTLIPSSYFSSPGAPGHLTLFCMVRVCWVRSHYYNAGNFLPTKISLPPYLTFCGGGVFGYVVSQEALEIIEKEVQGRRTSTTKTTETPLLSSPGTTSTTTTTTSSTTTSSLPDTSSLTTQECEVQDISSMTDQDSR